MMIDEVVLKVLLIVILRWSFGNCQTSNDSKTLRRDLLDGYDKFVRPVENQTHPVDVNVYFSLIALQDFDEVQEKFSVTGVFVLYWIDEHLRWENVMENYGNITAVSMGYKDVWVPELILTNPSQKLDSFGKEWQILHYESNGLATWLPADLIKATCSIDVRYFPFDIQECSMELYVWGYTSNEVRLIATRDDIETSYQRGEHGTWRILNTSATIELVGFSARFKLTFRLERKSQFVVVNIALPILFMCFLNVLVFILPAESGERVSYAITVLLAIAVFMTIISDTLPKKSEPLPLISYFLMTDLIVSALTSLFTILNLRIYHKNDDKPVPSWLSSMYRLLSCSWRRDMETDDNLFKRNSKKDISETRTKDNDSKFKERDTIYEMDLTSREAYKHSQRFNSNTASTRNEANVEWKDISKMFDYILLVFFSLVTFISFITFLTITKVQ